MRGKAGTAVSHVLAPAKVVEQDFQDGQDVNSFALDRYAHIAR